MEGNYLYFNNRLYNPKLLEYVTDKRLSAKQYTNYFLMRLLKMFEYKNLPDTIPYEILETYLILNGTAFVTKVNNDLYVFEGSMGGEPDVYYRPTKYIVANPALKLSKEYDIVKDGVLVKNDYLWLGLYPMLSRYSSMLAENLVTLRMADIMLRVVAMITSPDDNTKNAAEIYLKKLEKGELGVIGENRFFEGIKMQSPPSNNGSYLTQFIELHQYLKASFYNEIGLDANFNMKREAINANESALNQDSLLPLCELMLETRKENVRKINEMYGTDISVDFSSAWKINMDEIEIELSQLNNGDNNGQDNSFEGYNSSEDATNESNTRESNISDESSGSNDASSEHNINQENDENSEKISDTSGTNSNGGDDDSRDKSSYRQDDDIKEGVEESQDGVVQEVNINIELSQLNDGDNDEQDLSDKEEISNS